MARTRFHNCFKKYSYTCNSNSKRTQKQEIQHLQSTKKQSTPQKIKTAQEDKEFKDRTIDYFPPSDTQNLNTNEVMCSMIMNDEISMGYMYLTVRFPHRSASGHEYLLVGYNYDANAILVEPLKNAKQRILQKYGRRPINNSQHQDFNPTHMY